MNTESYSFFKIDVADGIATVMFNRPDVGNNWSLAEEHELYQLPTDIATDPEIKAVILTGAGDTFSGGAHHSDDPFDAFDYYDRSCRLFGGFMNIDKPLVVAVNGAIGGSGLTLAMFGDIVIAERHVVFSDPHVKVGVSSATGPFQWVPSIGLMRAKRYLMTGEAFSAEDAERMGLISEVVDTGRSVERANEYARQLAELPPSAVQATKRALNQWLRMAFGPIFQHALSLEFMTFPVAALNYGAGADTPTH
jgi:enoyl-CoA hydratase